MDDNRLRALGALGALALAAAPGELSYGALKEWMRGHVGRDPIDTVVATITVAATLFYAAEKGHNPKVTSYSDALVFVSTCLSVGYSDIFARTPVGKAIASAMMTFGPAVTVSIFEAPKKASPASPDASSIGAAERLLAGQEALASRLEALAARLEGSC